MGTRCLWLGPAGKTMYTARSVSWEMGGGETPTKYIHTRAGHTLLWSVNLPSAAMFELCISQLALIFVQNVFLTVGRIIDPGTFWTNSYIYTHRHSPPPPPHPLLSILPPLRRALTLHLRAFAVLLCTPHGWIAISKGTGKDELVVCETAFHWVSIPFYGIIMSLWLFYISVAAQPLLFMFW